MSGNNETELIAQRDQLLLRLAAVTKERDEQKARADKLQAALDGMEPVYWERTRLSNGEVDVVDEIKHDNLFKHAPIYRKPEVK